MFSVSVTKMENGVKIPVTQKSVVASADTTLRYLVYGRAVNAQQCSLVESLSNPHELPDVLEKFRNMRLCTGLGNINVQHLSADTTFKDYVDGWRSNDCALVSKKKTCDGCRKNRELLRKRAIRSKTRLTINRIYRASNPFDQRKIILLQKRNLRERRQKKRTQQRITLLQQSLREKSVELSTIRAETLDARCSELSVPAAQKNALKEIISAASKKNIKNRRYSEEWIMLCLLMNIRSPGYYEFLRKNNVLPLPCTRTIRSYFSLIDMKCGFDPDFAKLLKQQFDAKSPLQRHGVLLLDEINLRKSVAVCSKNLTYVGLTDLGNDGSQSSDIQDQATHGLVLMFQSLAHSYTQPIAVFASKNPVKGDELAKLVLKGISYLEGSGAKIHGVIADGAATNGKMWSLLGISGSTKNTKTWFTHPLDDERKVFVFSDSPHAFKNIRNRLYNKRKLRVRLHRIDHIDKAIRITTIVYKFWENIVRYATFYLPC